MTTYPTAAIREAMLRAGCSLAMTDAAMYHLELLAAKPEAKTITCEEAGCDTCPAQAAKEASTDQPPQPSIEERVAKLEAIVHDGELRSRVIGLETRGDKLAREVYRMGGEVKLPAPSPESPTGGERRTDWKCETGVCECPEFDCRVRRGEKCRHADCEPAPKASDQPPAPVGQPGVPAGYRLGDGWLAAEGDFTECIHHVGGTEDGAFDCDETPTFENDRWALCTNHTIEHGGLVPVEPSRPGTGEARTCPGDASCGQYAGCERRPHQFRPLSPVSPGTGEAAKTCSEWCMRWPGHTGRCSPDGGCIAPDPCPHTPLSRCPKHPLSMVRTEKTHLGGVTIPALVCEECALDVRRALQSGFDRGMEIKDLRAQLATRTAEVESLRAERDATRDALGEEKLRRIEYGEEFGRVCEERDKLRAAATAQVARIAELEAHGEQLAKHVRRWVDRAGADYPSAARESLARLDKAPAPKATP